MTDQPHSLTFPRRIEEVQTAWLSEVLGKSVQQVQIEPFGEGSSIIGMVTRLRLQSDDGEMTLIAKFPSPAEENRAVAGAYRMYEREVAFYQHISEQVQVRVPKCYFAAFDHTQQAFVLLLEDLATLQIGDQVAGCSVQQAQLVIDGIATLHASGWQLSSPHLMSHNNPMQRDGMMAGFSAGWPVVCEHFADLIPAAHKDHISKLPECVPGLLTQMCTPPVCITHADVRLDNIFFAADHIALVDWQSVCTSAPEQDLAYFVTQSLSDEVRASRDWVAYYHTALSNRGVSYDLAQCRARYRSSALYLLCYAVIIAGTLDLGNERGRHLGRTLFGNAMRSLVELHAFELIR